VTLRVRLFPADRSGCGHYRCIFPGRAVEALDEDVELEWVFDPTDDGSLELQLVGSIGVARVVGVTHPGCDVVVLQRPAHRHLAEAIPFLQAHGVAVVCDFDDDFENIDTRNPAWRAYNPRLSPELNSAWARVAAQYADLVTVTTPALARRYGGHGRVVTLPNYVPESHLDAKPLEEWARPWLKLGYAGSAAAHPGDLEVTGDAVRRLLDSEALTDRFGFLAVGGEGILRNLGLRADPRVEVMSAVHIEEYPSALASLDVGIIPLRDSVFNRAKSWLKGIEYAAAGVPFVASPTQQYKALADLGVGSVVGTTTRAAGAWTRALAPLLEDTALRELRAEEGRLAVRALTYERHGWRWLQAWSDALTVRRAGPD
jgi:hypothetical protein